MMPKMSAWAGYVWRICLLILIWISAAGIDAQSESARFLWAKSDEIGFVAQVIVADGLSIESARLETSSESISLTSASIPNETWFIVDASRAVVDSAPAIQAVLQRYLTAPTAPTGLLGLSSTVETLAPSENAVELSTWLGDYRAYPNENACLGDALQWLNEQALERGVGRKVMAIMGEYHACDYPDFVFPLAILVVGADAAPYGEDAVGASLQNLEQRFTSSLSRLNQAYFALTGTNPSEASGELQITLSNGENLSFAIEYELILPPTATPAPTDTPSQTTAPSPTAEATEMLASITSIPNTEAVSTEPVATVVPENTSPTAPSVSNNTLILAGGIAAVLVVVVVMVLLLRGSRRQKVSKEDMVDTTLLFRYNDEAELDQTEIVSMRQMIAQTRPTLAARLRDENGNVYEIHRPVTTLGRKEDSDIRIANDKQISREHLRFSVRDDGGIWLTRLSQNPVLVNEIPIENVSQLKNGDVLRLSPNLRLSLETVGDE